MLDVFLNYCVKFHLYCKMNLLIPYLQPVLISRTTVKL